MQPWLAVRKRCAAWACGESGGFAAALAAGDDIIFKHHPDGLEVAIGAMKREGISDADIDIMMRKNPAQLLGLN